MTNVAAGATTPIQTQIGTGSKELLNPARNIFVEIQPNGTVGATGSYSFTPTYTQVAGSHQRICGTDATSKSGGQARVACPP